MEDHAEDRSAHSVEDGARAIDFTLYCVHCGYNLRGLLRGGRCPECGEPVSDSPVDDALHACAPEWLRAITRGATWLYAGCLVFVATFIVMLLMLFLFATGPAVAISATLLGVSTFLLVPVMLLTGVIMLTRQEARVALMETRTAWRPLSRWSVIMLIASILASWMIDWGPLSSSFGRAQVFIESAVHVFRGIMICAFVICLTRYSAQLALRLPDSKLAQCARRRGNRFVVCYVIVGVLGGIEMWLSRGGPGALLPPTTIGGFGLWGNVAIGLTKLAVFAYTVGLMSATGQLRSALKKCMAEVSNPRA